LEPIKEPDRKRPRIKYNRKRAKDAIAHDYLGPTPLFDDRQFMRMFRVSKQVYHALKAIAMQHPFLGCGDVDQIGRETIGMNAKLLIALKHMGYGVSFNCFRDFSQMAEPTACLSFLSFLDMICDNTDIRNQYF
jgi:hypothetical protein